MEGNPGRDAVVRELIRHRSSLFAFILSLVRDLKFAEEVMQEVAVFVCGRWADFRPGTPFGAWAARIARNLTCKMSRAARREILLSKEAIEGIERAQEAEPQAGLPEAVRKCLERVSGRTRSILAMRYRQGMSAERIARRSKSTVAAAHKALSRARTVLARCVEGRPASGREPG